MDLGVHGEAFVITGGSDGLGLATARSLLAESAHVTICGRDKRRLDDAVTALGHDVHAVPADVTRIDDLTTLIDAATDRWGRLDGLLNAVGVHTGGRFEDVTDEEWIADYELKFLAATRAIRLALPHLRTSRGAVVDVLSTGARTPGRKAMPSAPLRAAGLSMTNALSTELGPDGSGSTRSSSASSAAAKSSAPHSRRAATSRNTCTRWPTGCGSRSAGSEKHTSSATPPPSCSRPERATSPASPSTSTAATATPYDSASQNRSMYPFHHRSPAKRPTDQPMPDYPPSPRSPLPCR